MRIEVAGQYLKLSDTSFFSVPRAVLKARSHERKFSLF